MSSPAKKKKGRGYADVTVNGDYFGTVKVSDLHDTVDVKKTLTVKTVKPDHSRFFEPGYVYAPYVPLQKTTVFSPSDFRRRGRFPLLSRLRDPFVPRPGTLVRAVTGDKQFGIVGLREGVVGVFWSGDGWIADYDEGELEEMFSSCVEVVS